MKHLVCGDGSSQARIYLVSGLSEDFLLCLVMLILLLHLTVPEALLSVSCIRSVYSRWNLVALNFVVLCWWKCVSVRLW